MYELMEDLEKEVGTLMLKSKKLSKTVMLEHLVRGLQFFARHQVFVRVMLCEVGVPSINVVLQNYIENLALRWFKILNGTQNHDTVKIDFIAKYSSTAYIGVIKWWLENDMPYSAEYMAEQFLHILSGGVFHSLGLDSIT